MIDLCKVFGVEEGEEFKIIDSKCENNNNKYVINDGQIYYNSLVHEHYWSVSYLELNEISGAKIIKLPKKKQFTDDELVIIRNIDKKFKWIARDRDGSLYLHEEKTEKREKDWLSKGDINYMVLFENLFNSIKWEDEEPTHIPTLLKDCEVIK